MSISRVLIPITTGTGGAGTASSPNSINGEILSVRMPQAGTALTGTGGTAQFTITRAYDGGTILQGTVGSAPWQYQPRHPIHTVQGGTTAYNTGVGPVLAETIPVLGTITVVAATCAVSQSGTVEILYRR